MSFFHPVSKRKNTTELVSLQDQMNHLFDHLWSGWPTELTNLQTTTFLPSLDLKENETEYLLEVELPGMTEKDVEISVHDNTLFLKGEKKKEEESQDKKTGFHRIERSYGSFSRAIPLTEEIDEESINASLKNGLLKLNLKKVPRDRTKKKVIPIGT